MTRRVNRPVGMRSSGEWWQRTAEERSCSLIFSETPEAVQAKCRFGGGGRIKGHLVKHPACVVHEIDGHPSLRRINERPVLLEHLDYLEPIVTALDGDAFVHEAAGSSSFTLSSALNRFVSSVTRCGVQVRDWCGRDFIWRLSLAILSASRRDTALETVPR